MSPWKTLAVGALLWSGCMAHPYDNENIDDHAGLVTFGGGQLNPSEQVDIQVCTNIYFDYLDDLRMKCGRGETFASATAHSAATYVDSFELSWFGWSAPLRARLEPARRLGDGERLPIVVLGSR
jgi:hypothetical protein